MYLKFEISTRGLRSLFWEAQGRDWSYRFPCIRPEPRCALCGAQEYPYRFPLPHPWPRLYGVVTAITGRRDGKQVASLAGNASEALCLPIEDAEMLSDTVYLYHFCRYHGRPETAGWVDYRTNCLIEWFPEPSERDLARFNLLNRINYTLWVAMRFLGSLVALEFIAVRLKVRDHPWQA